MQASNTYYLLSDAAARSLDYSVLTDDSYETSRKSIDGTMVIVEHDGSAVLTGGTELTYQEALALVVTSAWWVEDELD